MEDEEKYTQFVHEVDLCGEALALHQTHGLGHISLEPVPPKYVTVGDFIRCSG